MNHVTTSLSLRLDDALQVLVKKRTSYKDIYGNDDFVLTFEVSMIFRWFSQKNAHRKDENVFLSKLRIKFSKGFR